MISMPGLHLKLSRTTYALTDKKKVIYILCGLVSLLLVEQIQYEECDILQLSYKYKAIPK